MLAVGRCSFSASQAAQRRGEGEPVLSSVKGCFRKLGVLFQGFRAPLKGFGVDARQI